MSLGCDVSLRAAGALDEWGISGDFGKPLVRSRPLSMQKADLSPGHWSSSISRDTRARRVAKGRSVDVMVFAFVVATNGLFARMIEALRIDLFHRHPLPSHAVCLSALADLPLECGLIMLA